MQGKIPGWITRWAGNRDRKEKPAFSSCGLIPAEGGGARTFTVPWSLQVM